MKTCSNKHCILPNLQEETKFHKNSQKYDGLQSYCKKCTKNYRKDNLERIRQYQRKYYKNNKESVKKSAKQWQQNNIQKRLAIVQKWNMINAEKERKRKKEWKKAHPGKTNALTAKRRATKLLATPRWLTKQHLIEIEQFYIEAKELSWLSEGGLTVDHIVPLQGKDVCGLHVPWNLQIIDGKENFKKGNKLILEKNQ